jgi:hypothetical protein
MKLRLAVGSPFSARSATWLIFTTGNEAYAAHRSAMGVEKFSFHSSRICRRAFVSDRELPDGMTDRVLNRWTRAETPDPTTGGAVAVLSIVFPTVHLSSELVLSRKPQRWITAAPIDSSRLVQLFFTRLTKAELDAIYSTPDVNELLTYHQLPNGEAFAVSATTTAWAANTVIIEPLLGSEAIVLPNFQTRAPRRVQFSLFEQPDEMRCFELTGFKMDYKAACNIFKGAEIFSRRRVIARGPIVAGKAL